jgi:hypothetical protein
MLVATNRIVKSPSSRATARVGMSVSSATPSGTPASPATNSRPIRRACLACARRLATCMPAVIGTVIESSTIAALGSTISARPAAISWAKPMPTTPLIRPARNTARPMANNSSPSWSSGMANRPGMDRAGGAPAR